MGDVMMFGIARMPYEMAMDDELSRLQFYQNTQSLVAALEAAREDVKAVGTVLGGEFHYLRPSHGLPDGTMLYAIDQARGKGGGEVEGG